jgi:hypothetical protein
VIEVRCNLKMIGKGDADDLPKESLYRAGIANEYKLGFVKPAVDDFTSHRHKNPKHQRMTTERSKPFPSPCSHPPPYRLNTKMIDPMRRPRHTLRSSPDSEHPRKVSNPNKARHDPTSNHRLVEDQGDIQMYAPQLREACESRVVDNATRASAAIMPFPGEGHCEC